MCLPACGGLSTFSCATETSKYAQDGGGAAGIAKHIEGEGRMEGRGTSWSCQVHCHVCGRAGVSLTFRLAHVFTLADDADVRTTPYISTAVVAADAGGEGRGH